MHFIGMSAVRLYNSEDELIYVDFRIDLTIASLIAVLACTLLGLWIGTVDKSFAADKRDVIDSFIEDLRSKTIQEIRNIKGKNAVVKEALFRNLIPLIIGGFFIASGVCIMHYIGMMAMVFDGYIVWNAGIVAASCLIALVAATAALWIMFRLLAMFPNLELLRFVCAVVMAIAVNGMHYTGMAAATFKYEAGRASTINYEVVSTTSAVEGSLIAAALFLSFVFIISLSDLRIWHHNVHRTFHELDSVLQPALLEDSKERRALFLQAYIKFRDAEGDDKAIMEFRSVSGNIANSRNASRSGPTAVAKNNLAYYLDRSGSKKVARQSVAKIVPIAENTSMANIPVVDEDKQVLSSSPDSKGIDRGSKREAVDVKYNHVPAENDDETVVAGSY